MWVFPQNKTFDLRNCIYLCVLGLKLKVRLSFRIRICLRTIYLTETEKILLKIL